ncbi:hypothetical protein ACN9MJ_10710 [Acidovorax facilis]|uniref:hypothetical protein n=1 Tax=Acidovorax facilis TaxID=12917 RepID=UPI003CE913E1
MQQFLERVFECMDAIAQKETGEQLGAVGDFLGFFPHPFPGLAAATSKLQRMSMHHKYLFYQ